MKRIILIIIVATIFSCEKSEKKEKPIETVKKELHDDSKVYVEFFAEKVTLLAIIKDIPAEKLKSILIDYYGETAMYDKITIEENEKVILKLCDKYQLSKTELASLIYQFQYEMLTQEEVIEIEDQKRADEKAAE